MKVDLKCCSAVTVTASLAGCYSFATLSALCKPQTDDWLEEAGLDKKVCEAELLSRLLEEKEVCEWSKKSASAGPKTAGDAADVNKKPQEPWPAHKACVDTGDEPDVGRSELQDSPLHTVDSFSVLACRASCR